MGPKNRCYVLVLSIATVLTAQTIRFEATSTLGRDVADFGTAQSPKFGDFNGDGHKDFIIGAGKSIWLFTGVGGGRFGSPRDIAAMAAYDVGDFDGDQISDIVLTAPSSRVLFDASTGPFLRTQDVAPVSDGAHAVDLNGDGKLDLLFRTSESLLAHAGAGDGTFGQPVETPSCLIMRHLS